MPRQNSVLLGPRGLDTQLPPQTLPPPENEAGSLPCRNFLIL